LEGTPTMTRLTYDNNVMYSEVRAYTISAAHV